MKVVCPKCGKEVDSTKQGKYAPHNDGHSRCSMSCKHLYHNKKKGQSS